LTVGGLGPRFGNPQDVAGALPGPPAGASVEAATTAATFSGSYKLTLTPSASCSKAIPSVAVLVDVTEDPVQQPATVATPIAQGTEIFGVAAAPPDSAVGRFVLLRQGDRLHGGFGTKDLGIQTLEGQRVWVRLAGTGQVTASGPGRPRVDGTAIGDFEVSLPGDAAPDTLGACLGARDHAWSLQPQ
jgi:hypothetical protein